MIRTAGSLPRCKCGRPPCKWPPMSLRGRAHRPRTVNNRGRWQRQHTGCIFQCCCRCGSRPCTWPPSSPRDRGQCTPYTSRQRWRRHRRSPQWRSSSSCCCRNDSLLRTWPLSSPRGRGRGPCTQRTSYRRQRGQRRSRSTAQCPPSGCHSHIRQAEDVGIPTMRSCSTIFHR